MRLEKLIRVKCLVSLALMLLLLTTGCSSIQQTGVNIVAPTLADVVDQILNMKNVRAVKAGIPANVTLVAGITELSPDNVELLSLTSFLYCAYGLLEEDENPSFAAELYALGEEYGLRALKTDDDFAKGMASGEKISALVPDLDDEMLEALAWTSLNSGLRLLQVMDEDITAFIVLADIAALSKRAVEIDEGYFHGAVPMLMGVFNAVLPEYMGGGKALSKENFDKARKYGDNNLLLVDYFEAKYYAPLLLDEELFDELLEGIASRSSAALEGGHLLNELAKYKAAFLANNKERYF